MPRKAGPRCGKTLQRTGDTCGRPEGHSGKCLGEQNLARGRQQTAEWKAANADRVREMQREAMQRYRLTPEGQAADAARLAAWRATPGGKEKTAAASARASRKLMSTPEGREYTRGKVRQSYAKNPEAWLAADRRRRAREAGVQQEEVTKEQLRARQDNECYICGCELPFGERLVHVEHIIPLAAGLPHIFRRLALSCPPCNNGPGGKWTKALAPYLMERQRDGRPLRAEYATCLRVCPLFGMVS